MWFKNLIVYRLPEDWSVPAAELETQLSNRSLPPCGSFDMHSRGWVPVGPGQRFVHTANGQHLIALGVEEKLLPASIIRQVAGERAKELEEQQGYPVGRRQMRELKERVGEELRGRALTRKRATHAWIDPINRWLVIDAAGASRAEELIEALRDTLGTLAVEFLETERSVPLILGTWVMHGDAPLRFTIEQDLELQSPDPSKPTIRYVRHPLDGKDIRAHIGAGMFATRLGLTWSDRIAFVLTEKLQVKRLEFLMIEKDRPQGEEAQLAAEEQFDIDFTLMTGELAQLLADLVEVLGARPAQTQSAAA